jgi:hypothetical protein
MPKLTNPTLTIATDRPQDQARIKVSCDVEFTQFEVNEMNLLGLRYELSCRVLNEYLRDEDPVATYRPRKLPGDPYQARPHEHVVFSIVEAMSPMHEEPFHIKDKLVAELTLRNLETDERQTIRSGVVAVDLAV